MFALSAYFFSGCSNDYLDVDQTESISTKDIELFNNDAGAATFVTAIYSKFLDWNMTSFSWIGLSSIASDDADKGSSPGDTGSDKDLMDALTYNASTPSTSEIFAANYEGINRCNQALSIIPQLDKADPALRARLLGEAKFLRAFMYFTLVKTYGGVPIIDHCSFTKQISIPGFRKRKSFKRCCVCFVGKNKFIPRKLAKSSRQL